MQLKRDLALLAATLLLAVLGAQFATSVLHMHLRFANLWTAAWVLLAAPVIEEWIFRVRLQAALTDYLRLKLPLLSAHIASIALISVVFAACHAPLMGWQAAWVVVPSLALGACWAATQSGWRCALMHSFFNAALATFSTLT